MRTSQPLRDASSSGSPPDDRPRTAVGRAIVGLAKAAEDAYSALLAVGQAAADFYVAVRDLRRRHSFVVRTSVTFGLGTLVLSDGSESLPLGPGAMAMIVGVGVIGVRLLASAFSVLARDSARADDGHRVDRMAVPDLPARRAAGADMRRRLNRSLGRKLSPSLERHRFVKVMLKATRRRIATLPTELEMSLVLVRAGTRRFRVVATSGPVDDNFKFQSTWERTEILNGGVFLDVCTPLGYEVTHIHFMVGRTEYFLVGIATDPIHDLAVLALDDVATALVRACVEQSQLTATGDR